MIVTHTERKTRKDRQCEFCAASIQTGETYIRMKGIGPDGPFDRCSCHYCANAPADWWGETNHPGNVLKLFTPEIVTMSSSVRETLWQEFRRRVQMAGTYDGNEIETIAEQVRKDHLAMDETEIAEERRGDYKQIGPVMRQLIEQVFFDNEYEYDIDVVPKCSENGETSKSVEIYWMGEWTNGYFNHRLRTWMTPGNIHAYPTKWRKKHEN